MAPDEDDRFRLVLRAATDTLRECLADAPAGSGDTPYLDALILLAHAASKSTEQVFAALEDRVPRDVLSAFEELVTRRCAGEPVSYIRGVKEFYGRQFAVGRGVLVPRPDTETLVETVLGVLAEEEDQHPHVHDCCTGSGCVAITVACETSCLVTASDLSDAAIGYATRNASSLGFPSMEIWRGDLLEPLEDRVQNGLVPAAEIVTANPPYVTDNEVNHLTERGWPEPRNALAGGADGLDFVRRLVTEAPACLANGGWLMVEIGSDQGPAAAGLFNTAGFKDVSLVRDLAGHVRVCRGRWFRT